MKNGTATILMLIAIGFFYTFISPQYEKSKALRDEAGQYERVLDSVSALNETRNELSLKLADMLSAEVEKMAKVLPSSANTVRLSTELDSIASRYGVTIREIQASSQVNEGETAIDLGGSGAYEKVVISFQFVSTYESFRSFLNDVERSLRIIDVKSIEFAVGETDFYEYQVTIETYWMN